MFRKLLTLDEAQLTIRKYVDPKPLGVEKASLLEAHNGVLAEDVTASFDIPPFNRSTVDGYAVRAEDSYEAEENRPVRLKITGTAGIGELPKATVACGEAVEIVTGAPMPESANAVVMMEHTERDEGWISVFSPVAKHGNIMKAGGDIRQGETALKAGQVLGSPEIGVLAAMGQAIVRVNRAPKVAVLSTGGELVEPGKKLPHGKIYDINAHSLSAAVLESGGKPLFLGVFLDDKAELQKTLQNALASSDLIVTSGGVSVGPKDLVPQVVNSLGKPGIIVSGIAIKPGKPTTVAVVNGKLVFSLPGHPTSALLVFHLLVRPIISCMAGREAQETPKVEAAAGIRMFSARGRRTFVMVKLQRGKSDLLVAQPVETGVSDAITTLAKADGYVEVDERTEFVDEGEIVKVSLLRNLKSKFLA